MKKIILIVVSLILLLTILGCSSEEADSQEEVRVQEPDFVRDETQVEPTGVVHQVVIENNQFNPHELEISAGDTVEWVNKDTIEHSVTLENGEVDVLLPPGGVHEYTFTWKNIFAYFDLLNPDIRGSVISE